MILSFCIVSRDLYTKIFFGPNKDRLFCTGQHSLVNNLLRASVFGDGLGGFRDSVFGQFTWEEKTDSSLDLPGGDG